MKAIQNWSLIYKAYYLEKRSNSSIIEEFGLPVKQALFKCFPLYIHTKIKCEYCGAPFHSAFIRRSASQTTNNFFLDIASEKVCQIDPHDRFNNYYDCRFISSSNVVMTTNEGYLVDLPRCLHCEHKPSKSCTCDGCINQTTLNRSVVAEQLLSKCKNNFRSKPDYSELNCKELFLGLYCLTYGLIDNKDEVSLKRVDPKNRQAILNSGIFILDLDSVKKSVHMLSTFEYSIDEEEILYKINGSEADSPDLVLVQLKQLSVQKLFDIQEALAVVDVWGELALQEALNLLMHYCEVFKLTYRPGEQTISSIKRSLNRYGLAQTARYIYNAVKRAHTYGLEKNFDRTRSFNLIYGNLNFWIDDERARTWNAPPFNRGEQVLTEPKSSIIFSHSFLEPHGLDFFCSPINVITIARTQTTGDKV
ncbi:hypothetical protein [Alkalimarinus alittae]|uniref:Transposase n=1 Tax=Alkalimarinus alittae TaxID=2961619 RepID=A0ABY6N679_9ALTE|nr:hypothetical protein [Alkalimarinus alittae]UZE97623.1 hypothetical protein NKI27_07780 [Alkalimarinus alittae]